MRDLSLPAAAAVQTTTTRADLLVRWTAARRRRDVAPLGSAEHRASVIEVGELEVMINAVDVTVSEGRDVQPARP